MKYVHTNIVSRDWKKLARFYQDVFLCTPVPPLRSQSGDWLAKGTGVRDATLEGIHLRLPGHGNHGPTLEIYQYASMLPAGTLAPNKLGFGHIAFEVDDVRKVLVSIIKNGGKAIGEVAEKTIPGLGTIQFIYATDPEGNILEIQHWSNS